MSGQYLSRVQYGGLDVLRNVSCWDDADGDSWGVPRMCLQLCGLYESELGCVIWVEFDVYLLQRIKFQEFGEWELHVCEFVVF